MQAQSASARMMGMVNGYFVSQSLYVAATLGIAPLFLEKNDIHVHVPQGGIPKDGPSAGVALVTAITSLMTGRPVRSELAMTGEITLRGIVLPIGGVKEKVLAAHRAGIKRIVAPERNRPDLEEIPDEVKSELEFVFVGRMDEVIDAALERAPVPRVGALVGGIVPSNPAAAAPA